MGMRLSPELERKVLELAGQVQPHVPAIVDEGQSEKAFQADVVRFAKACGWEDVYHTFNSKRSSPGFPDCIFARGDREPFMVVAELKVGDNEPSEDQERWLRYFQRIGVPTFVWYPRNWPLIEQTLR